MEKGERSIFKTKSGLAIEASQTDIANLKGRDKIFEELKKEKGIERPEELPFDEFVKFRTELFRRYKEFGV